VTFNNYPSTLNKTYSLSYRWLFQRSLVVDGNFSAQHLKMRRAEKDIRLVKGEGYMVEEDSYQCHLHTAQDIKEVCPFQD
jgi:hypothetical protein